MARRRKLTSIKTKCARIKALREALIETHGSIAKAAALLQTSRQLAHYTVRHLGLSVFADSLQLSKPHKVTRVERIAAEKASRRAEVVRKRIEVFESVGWKVPEAARLLGLGKMGAWHFVHAQGLKSSVDRKRELRARFTLPKIGAAV